METYHLTSRFTRGEMNMAIESPDSSVYREGLPLRFVKGDSVVLETSMKVEGHIRLSNGLHGLLGRGVGQFAHQWFFIPGMSTVPCHLSTVLIVMSVKEGQSLKQLQLELEAATVKAFEPQAPA